MLVHSRLFCSQPVLREGVGRHCDDGNFLCVLSVQRADHPGGLVAVHNRHHDVHQDHVKFTGAAFFEYIQGFPAIPRLGHDGTLILEHKFRDFHIQPIVFRQKNMEALDRLLRCILLLLPLVPILIDLKRDPDHKGSPHTFFTFEGDGSPHFLDQLLGNRHSQACSRVFCAAAGILLCKGLKNTFLERLGHPDPRIPADKFHCGYICPLGWELLAAHIDLSVFLVILHRVGQDIHHHPFHMARASDELPVKDPFLLQGDPDILLRGHLLNHNQHFLSNAAQIKGDLFQDHFLRLQLAHVQDFVDQLQQQMGCLFDLSPALRLLLYIRRVMVGHVDHAADPIDRRPDVMAHTLEELGFGLVGSLRFFRRSQKLRFVLLLLFLFQLLVGQIGPVHPEPEYTEYQKIKKDSTCYTQGQIVEHFRIRQIGIDVVVPLLQHDPVASGPILSQVKNVPAVRVLLHGLNHLVVRGILAKQTLIVAGNDHPLIRHKNRSVFLGTVAIQ